MEHSRTRERLGRRQFLARFGALGLVALCGSPAWARRSFGAGKLSVAEAFDREMEQYMSARGTPGGALAVVKDRRLVYVRGYGFADRGRGAFHVFNL